jgi:hypothetical protein
MITSELTGAMILMMAAAATATAGARGEADPRTAWHAGQRAQGAERRRHFAAGITSARALLAADPDHPEGLLWLAANLGAEALERGKVGALRVIPEMERLLLRLDARHPLHDHAAAARTLAVLYHRAPALISIGSNARARTWFQRALERAGTYPANLVLAAQFFDDVGEDERARALARAYLAAPASPADHPDAAAWDRSARRIAGRDR